MKGGLRRQRVGGCPQFRPPVSADRQKELRDSQRAGTPSGPSGPQGATGGSSAERDGSQGAISSPRSTLARAGSARHPAPPRARGVSSGGGGVSEVLADPRPGVVSRVGVQRGAPHPRARARGRAQSSPPAPIRRPTAVPGQGAGEGEWVGLLLAPAASFRPEGAASAAAAAPGLPRLPRLRPLRRRRRRWGLCLSQLLSAEKPAASSSSTAGTPTAAASSGRPEARCSQLRSLHLVPGVCQLQLPRQPRSLLLPAPTGQPPPQPPLPPPPSGQ